MADATKSLTAQGAAPVPPAGIRGWFSRRQRVSEGRPIWMEEPGPLMKAGKALTLIAIVIVMLFPMVYVLSVSLTSAEDAARGGLNDVMAEILGMSAAVPLRPHPDMPSCGLGRIGTVRPITLSALSEAVARGFDGAPVSYAGDPWIQVRRLASCTGSGASLIDDARAAEADAFVTSDLKYHDADRAAGLPLVHLPHARAERVAMKRWSKVLGKAVASQGVEVRFAETDTDPWQVA